MNTPDDLRDAPLTAAQLHVIADLLYEPGDPRAKSVWPSPAALGAYRIRLRAMAELAAADEGTGELGRVLRE